MEDRFGLRAPEQTTEEFLEAMRDSYAIERAHKDLLKEFLRHADMVKFAELTPGPADAERAADSARRFIEQTIAETDPLQATAAARVEEAGRERKTMRVVRCRRRRGASAGYSRR